MHVRDDYGLAIAEADAHEALAAHRAGDLPPVALLRVPDPPRETWTDLERAGFVRKPVWLSWRAPTPRSVDEYAARLARKARQDLRRAIDRAADAGVRVEVHRTLTADQLDPFLRLYESRVSGMRFGFSFAGSMRDGMIDNPRTFGVFAYDDGELVGGCLCREFPEDDSVWLLFSAVEARWREHSLARVIYLHAFDETRRRGFPEVTMGNDPNLYGHVAKPGLFLFKTRLGFEPVPAKPVGRAPAGDCADLLLSVDALTTPVVMLGHADENSYHGVATPRLTARVFGAGPEVDIDRYTTRTVHTVSRVELPTPVAGATG
ncbi:GNAT family N-acetyltransferase [Micromonospora echinofusca]|uniref:GNAT family N-acetyltransferase n=1 Tax=Micromonospora echinofusca TaxID=47858 RepID=A0ABS3VTG9_MICEH|nr:GNAT family N-acetyltransferase [Micromonospora echinofusca]MBO4207834.1 GNAT family N-acetyltransferase [Micromonospora echinofusca]